MGRYYTVLVGILILSVVRLESSRAFTAPPTCSTSRRSTQLVVMLANKKRKDKSGGDDSRKDSTTRDSSVVIAFEGAGFPRPDLSPDEIPILLMKSLELNDFPQVDAGLESMWAFAGDTTRHIFQQNMTDFIESAHETADRFPTSFYGCAMYSKSWSMETELNRVGGENGWIATQVMKTISSDGRLRRWQWELRKNKRPPNMGCWFVESIGSSDRKGQFEPE